MQPTLKQWVFTAVNVAVTDLHCSRLIYLSIVEVEVAVGDSVIIHRRLVVAIAEAKRFLLVFLAIVRRELNLSRDHVTRNPLKRLGRVSSHHAAAVVSNRLQ
jgi:hypothetical protein